VSESPLSWDVSTKRRGPIAKLLRSGRTGVAVLVGVAALALLIVPIAYFVERVATRQGGVHRLEQLAKQAQPASAVLIDSGLKDDKGTVGFADGISTNTVATLLAQAPPPQWKPGPPLPESPDTRLYQFGKLILSVRVDPCTRLRQCRPGDALVYTEVQDIS
jgi:hypothetical protein